MPGSLFFDSVLSTSTKTRESKKEGSEPWGISVNMFPRLLGLLVHSTSSISPSPSPQSYLRQTSHQPQSSIHACIDGGVLAELLSFRDENATQVLMGATTTVSATKSNERPPTSIWISRAFTIKFCQSCLCGLWIYEFVPLARCSATQSTLVFSIFLTLVSNFCLSWSRDLVQKRGMFAWDLGWNFPPEQLSLLYVET